MLTFRECGMELAFVFAVLRGAFPRYPRFNKIALNPAFTTYSPFLATISGMQTSVTIASTGNC